MPVCSAAGEKYSKVADNFFHYCHQKLPESGKQQLLSLMFEKLSATFRQFLLTVMKKFSVTFGHFSLVALHTGMKVFRL